MLIIKKNCHHKRENDMAQPHRHRHRHSFRVVGVHAKRSNKGSRFRTERGRLPLTTGFHGVVLGATVAAALNNFRQGNQQVLHRQPGVQIMQNRTV